MESTTESVPVSGGASLATLVTLPGPGSYPVVIVRTVYGRRNLLGLGNLLSNHGYASIIQDVRGSGDSSGKFNFLAQEPEDALETTQWILRQPWCDGRLAILGISYLSSASIAIAAEFPEHVKAAVWVTIPAGKEILCFQGGALRLHHTLPWVYMKEAPLSSFDPEAYYTKTPLIDAIPQNLDSRWSLILKDGPRSEFWRKNDLWHYIERVRVPGLHFGGWFDFLLDATLVPYSQMNRSGAPQRLVLGPWSHNGVVGTEKISGDISYGCPAGIFREINTSSHFMDECIRWLDYWVKKMGEVSAWRPVRCFFTGDRPHWQELDSWPAPGGIMRMYLGSKGIQAGRRTEGAHARGILSTDLASMENATALCDSFVYNPENPTPTEGGAVWAFTKASLIPGPAVSSVHLRDDVLIYDSEMLGDPLKICGIPQVELYASSSAPDTDFTAIILDVDQDGVARYVSDGIIRARYRNSLEIEEFLEPGETYLFRISMKGCAHTFGPGHRVRLVISSSNFPKFDRNPNTGEPIYQTRAMREAVQTVYYGAATSSALIMPTPIGPSL